MNDMFRTPIDFPKATFNIDHPQSIFAGQIPRFHKSIWNAV